MQITSRSNTALRDEALDLGLTPTRAGDRFVFSNGYSLPVVCGGAEGDDPPAPTPPAPGTDPANVSAADLAALEKFAQGVGAREKDQGKRAGQRAVLESLGLDPDDFDPEVVKGLLEKAAAADDAVKSDAQKALEKAQRAEQTANERAAEAAKLIATGVKREALRDAGVPKANLELALGLLTIEGDVTEESATAAAEALKANPALKSLFDAVTEPGAGDKPAGAPDTTTGGGPPAGGPGAATAFERGADRAKAANAKRGDTVLSRLGGTS